MVLWVFIRAPLFVLHTAFFITLAASGRLLSPAPRWPVLLGKLQRAWARSLLWLLGIRVTVSQAGVRTVNDPPALLRVANHISYLDIPVLLAQAPGQFIAKAEVAHWPVLGWMASLSGTIFVQRSRGESTARAAQRMQARLGDGRPQILFPEATTTDGSRPVQFRSALLQPAIDARAPISLWRIDYGGANSEAAFVNDDALAPHLLRFMGRPRTRATLRWIGDYAAPHPERKILAGQLAAALNAMMPRPCAAPIRRRPPALEEFPGFAAIS